METAPQKEGGEELPSCPAKKRHINFNETFSRVFCLFVLFALRGTKAGSTRPLSRSQLGEWYEIQGGCSVPGVDCYRWGVLDDQYSGDVHEQIADEPAFRQHPTLLHSSTQGQRPEREKRAGETGHSCCNTQTTHARDRTDEREKLSWNTPLFPHVRSFVPSFVSRLHNSRCSTQLRICAQGTRLATMDLPDLAENQPLI